MDTMIIFGGPEAETSALYTWLCADAELRNFTRSRQAGSPDGTMGTGTEIVVTLASSGTLKVLARSISAWLVERERQRHADIELKLTTGDGQVVEVTGHRLASIADAERILRGLTSVELAPAATAHQSDSKSICD